MRPKKYGKSLWWSLISSQWWILGHFWWFSPFSRQKTGCKMALTGSILTKLDFFEGYDLGQLLWDLKNMKSHYGDFLFYHNGGIWAIFGDFRHFLVRKLAIKWPQMGQFWQNWIFLKDMTRGYCIKSQNSEKITLVPFSAL